MDLSALSHTLTKSDVGIWTPPNGGGGAGAAAISFPEGGYDDCFQVEDNSFWFAHRNECISLALAKFPFDGAFVDIGGGNGVVSQRLAADGIETVVLEPGVDGARNALKRGLPNVVCATLEQAAFNSAAFGAAGLFDVIEHVEDDEALLRSTRAILRRGGVLCVTVPAYKFLWSAEDVVAGHFRRYTLARLRSVLERTGFDVRYETYFFAPLTVPLFFVRSLRFRLGLRSVNDAATDETEAAKQHTPRPSARRAMDLLLTPETKLVKAGRTIPIGTSCLAVALAK